MKKQFLCFLIFILFNAALKAQTHPSIIWEESFGGSGYDYAWSIEKTTEGGLVVAGQSTSSNGDINLNHGGNDYCIIKLDSFGNYQWQKSLGGKQDDIASSCIQTMDGGFIAAGSSRSNDGNVSGHHGIILYADFWIVKMDALGNIQWEKSFGGTNVDVANSVLQTPDGGFVIAGYSLSTDGDVTGNHGTSDFWIIRLDASGNLIWQKSFGGSSGEKATSIQQTMDGGFIVAGDAMSNDGDVSGHHGPDHIPDYWVVKLDSSGNIQWQKCLGGTDSDFCHSVQQTTDHGFIVAGSANSHDGDVTHQFGQGDMWIVKLDSVGNLKWQESLGGTSDDGAQSILQTTDGGFMACGYSYSDDVDVSGHHGPEWIADYWVVKLDSSGNFQWQKSLEGTGTDRGYAVQQTSTDEFVVAGYSSSVDGDVTGNHGNEDCWIVKVAGCLLPDETIQPLGDLDICSTGAVKLKASTGTGYQYQWNRNQHDIPGATNPGFTASKTGNYRVRISTPGCHLASKQTIVYSSCLRDDEAAIPLSFNVYPNPSNGNFFLNLNLDGDESSTVQVEVINLLGQIIFSENTPIEHGSMLKEMQLPGDFEEGIYFIKVMFNNRMLTSQIELKK